MTLHKMQSLHFHIIFYKHIYIQKMWAPENWSGPLNFKNLVAHLAPKIFNKVSPLKILLP